MNSIKRILIFSTLYISLYIPSLAQQEQDKEQSRLYLEQAELIMSETQAIDDARDLMVAAANYDTTNVEANFDAGYMYLATTGKSRATKFLLRAYRQNPDYRFDIEYQIARSYQYALDFDKAIAYFELYKLRLEDNPNYQGADRISMPEVNRKIYESQNGKEYVANRSNHHIVNLGREINSEFDDYAPVLNESEDELVFTSRRRDGNLNENVSDDNKPYEDIFYSKKAGEKWERAKNIGKTINTLFNESNLALSPDGNTLFIYRDENAGDVYFSTRTGSDASWTAPEPLPGDVNSSYRETSVSISKDGNKLYFASDRPGGLGGSDIYVSTKNRTGEWTKVTNMGPRINTELDEDSPYIDIDGKTLYFSSEGKKGMGGFDIYKVTLINENRNEWSEAENLGFPINTPDNDIFYVGSKDSERGYYSSVRDDGMGYSDIYVVTTEPEKFASEEPVKKNTELLSLIYEIKVVDAKTQEPLDATVSFREGTNPIESRKLKPGEYTFNIKDPDPKRYNLTVELEGYIFQNLNIDLEGATEEVKMISKKIEMKKLVVGATSVLRNIYFDYGTAKFREESYDELNKLENMMKKNTNLSVEIAGHTDNVSSASFNLKLSQQRANAVRDFLISKGIEAKRVKAVGYGEERPLASNDDEIDGRELNRRVEFQVLNN